VFQRHSLSLLTLLVIATCAATLNNDSKSSKGFGKGKIFFKSYSTKTKTLLSFLTSTVPFTCYSVSTPAMACVRRKRSLSLPTDLEFNEDYENDSLDSSVQSELSDSKSRNTAKKFFVTLWSTSSSTLTITTFITNQRVTLSASVACTVPGVILPRC
ncbi:hypothetical protein Anas_10299, partial [Armadillidium nasatum]